MNSTLSMKFNTAITLEVHALCPVITYHYKIDILGVRVALKFHAHLLEVVDMNLRLICTCGNSILAVSRHFDAIRGLFKFKVLNELNSRLELRVLL